MNRPAIALLVTALGLVGASHAAAQPTAAKQSPKPSAAGPGSAATPHKSLSELAAEARAAKDNFKPVAKADVLARQVAAEAAVRRLDRYLKASGANGKGWLAYLHLQELSAELAKGTDANAKALHESAARYTGGAPGLELTQFQGVGKSLSAYADVLAAYQNADAKDANAKDMDALAAALDAAAKEPAGVNRQELGELLARISASGQSPQLVAAAREQLSQPNLLVRVSRGIVAGGIDDNINEITPVKDVILGTDVVGKGNTVGQVRSRLVPDVKHAIVEIDLTGTTNAKTVGYHDPVTVFSHSTTSLLGQKRIQFDEAAFAGLPATADCCTHNTIDSIDVCGGHLIQRIATKRVYSNKSTAEAISADHAETRLEGRMDTRSADMLTNLNRNFNEKFRWPLMRRGAFPQELKFSTTSDWLSIVGLQARPNELGAAMPAPEPAADAQLSVRVHESVIENFVAATIAGQTVRDERFKRMVRNVGGKKLNQEEFRVLLSDIGDTTESYDSFSALLKDRLDTDVTKPQFNVLIQAVRDKQVTPDQVKTYLQGLAEDSLTAESVNAMLGDLPEESQATLTFADAQPVTLRFRDGTVDVTLHATAYSSRNGVERDVPMNIRAVYKLDSRGGQMVATRQGELDISPPGFKQGDRLDTQQTAARGALRGRFDDIFKPEFKSTGLTLRGRWKRLGELPWSQLVSQDGWVAAGWTLPQPTRTAQADATPDLTASDDLLAALYPLLPTP